MKNKRVIKIMLLCLSTVLLVGCTTKSNGNDTDGQKDKGNTTQQKDLSPRVIVDKQGRIIGTAGLEDAVALDLDFNWLTPEDGSEWKGYEVMSGAFSDCTKLRDVWVSDTLKRQLVNVAEAAFAGCDTELTVHGQYKCKWRPAIVEAGMKWKSTDNETEDATGSAAPYYVMSETGVCLGISDSMHEQMAKKKRMTFPQDTTYIAESTIEGFYSEYQEVVIPKNVTGIGQYVFRGGGIAI